MMGDHRDLTSMMSIVATILFDTVMNQDEEEEYVTSAEIRKPVAAAIPALMAAFVAAEATHRRQYQLTGTKKVTGVSIPEVPIRGLVADESLVDPERVRG